MKFICSRIYFLVTLETLLIQYPLYIAIQLRINQKTYACNLPTSMGKYIIHKLSFSFWRLLKTFENLSQCKTDRFIYLIFDIFQITSLIWHDSELNLSIQSIQQPISIIIYLMNIIIIVTAYNEPFCINSAPIFALINETKVWKCFFDLVHIRIVRAGDILKWLLLMFGFHVTNIQLLFMILIFTLVRIYSVFNIKSLTKNQPISQNAYKHYCILKQQKMKGYEYVQGSQQPGCYQSILQTCGNCIGTFKAWCPCIGCFCCCCAYPYHTVEQGSKGLLLRYNRYIETVDPGLRFINPLTDSLIKIDCRISVIDLPKQNLMTKDNISIVVDSCAYYHIQNPHLAHFRMSSLDQAVRMVSGGIIKNTVATFTFQELLEKRETLSQDIAQQIQPIVQHWGVNIDKIFLKDFGISQQLEQELVSAPIARRNAQSKIISAQADVEVAKMLANRSKILDTKTAIQVRYLQTIKSLAGNKNSSMIYTSF